MPPKKTAVKDDQDQQISEHGEVAIFSPPPKSVITDMATRYGMEAPAFEAALRATVVPKDVSPAQFAAFLLVAKEYNLNPLTKEIYAFPSRGGGIVPIVSIDGWVNLVNSHGACDGFDFEMEHDDRGALISCTCRMHRKDRQYPVIVTEYLVECIRQTDPWKMKHRMLRHKAMIQAARYAFGFSGIYDPDEGEKIAEINSGRDMAPPRSIAEASAEPAGASAAGPATTASGAAPRDAAPPRRLPAAEKPDPISSGPIKDVTTPRQAATEPKKEPERSHSDETVPHQVPGKDRTYSTWAAKYCDLLGTSADLAAVYGWIDKNAVPLQRLEKGMVSEFRKCKIAAEKLIDGFRAEAEKAATKAKPAASEMSDDGGDMTDGEAPDWPTSPEDALALIDRILSNATADNLESVWQDMIEPNLANMFPPDAQEAQGLLRKHEKRLGA